MGELDKYYQVLGLNPGASEGEVIQAYKILIRALQPDRFGKEESAPKIAEAKIREIDEALKTLLVLQKEQPPKTLEPILILEPEFSGNNGSIVNT
jgi:curved DNA-binding protein CbpA